MEKFPELKTERLILGKVTYKDIPKIIDYAGNKNVSDTTLNIPHPYEKDHALFWINSAEKGFEEGTQYTFAQRVRATDEFIGGIGLKIDPRFDRAVLGYWIAEEFWNKGYATEAVEAILKFGFFQLSLNKIYATHLVENTASGKVMIKNGMIKEGELKDHTKKGDQYRSLIQYRLTKEEYENNLNR